MDFNGQIQMMLASNSQFFLRGVSDIIRDKVNSIKVTTEALRQRIEERLTEMRPELLLLDNRSFRLDVHDLLSFILEKSPETRIILLDRRAEHRFNSLSVVCLNRDTGSSELRSIINREILIKGNGNGAKKSNVR